MLTRWHMALQDSEGVERLIRLLTPGDTKKELRERRIIRSAQIRRYRKAALIDKRKKNVA